MFDTLKAAAKVVTDKVSGTLIAGVESLTGSLDELSAASPELERIGYSIEELELVCALPPRVVIHFTRNVIIHAEAFGAVLANHPENKTIRTVVGLLQQTENVLQKITLTGRRCSGLAVELGLPPCVRLRYTTVQAKGPPRATCSSTVP